MLKVTNKLMPNTPVCSVRADTPISECVSILRNKNIGALIIAKDDGTDGLGGIFTERDLIKSGELIQRGDFWNAPVRTVMTTPVRTVTVGELSEAPKIMAKYHIRHLPVVSVENGKTHVIGVLSMRDIFRIMMESIDYNLEKISPTFASTVQKKSFGFFSQDAQLLSLAEKAAKLSQRVLQSFSHFNDHSSTAAHVAQFDAVLIDLDGMNTETLKHVMLLVKELANSIPVLLSYRPGADKDQMVHQLDIHRQIHILAKPIAFGLLYEQFLKAKNSATV